MYYLTYESQPIERDLVFFANIAVCVVYMLALFLSLLAF